MDLSLLHRYGPLLQILAAISALTFIISLVCIPLLVARLPSNYFQRLLCPANDQVAASAGKVVVLALRNLLGLLLLLAGIAMLVLPGQGIISIIIGLALMTFPGKNRLLNRLSQPVAVRKSLDWIRLKMKKEPFRW
ncbi:MAG: PGPGW domain-containing protein [Desulfopila sp.]